MQMDVVQVCRGRRGVIGTRSVDTGVNSALMRAQKPALRVGCDGLWFVVVIRETILWSLERKYVKVLLSLDYPFNKVEFTKELEDKFVKRCLHLSVRTFS